MSWTDDRVSVLKKLWGEGRTAAEIAKELGGVTRNAVIGKAHRLKLSNRVSPIQQNNKKPVQKVVERKEVERETVQQNVTVFVPSEKPKIRASQARLQSLLDLKPRACRWPVGDPKEEGFGFCGCDAIPGLPYCGDHAKLAYQPASRNRAIRVENYEDTAPAAASDDAQQGAGRRISG